MHGSDGKQRFTAACTHELENFLLSGGRLRLSPVECPRVSVLIVTFNRAELTLRCLGSLLENVSLGLELVLVDNASTDATSALIDRVDGVTLIRNRTNVGFLRAVNQAARAARGDVLLFLNNDAELLPGSLEAGLRVLDGCPDVGAVAARIISLDGRLQEAGSIVCNDGSCAGYGRGDSPWAPEYMFRRDVDFGSGACLLTRRQSFQAYGGFDEAFAPAYYEDSDFCLRLWQQGHRVVYEPRMAIQHFEFASSAEDEVVIDMQRVRQALFAQKHAEWIRRYQPPGPGSFLRARNRGLGPTLLLIDDQVPHAQLGSGFPRARDILMTLADMGWRVTFYPTARLEEPWVDVYRDTPAEVEVMLGWGPARLGEFLEARRGYYERILVSRPHNMSRLQRILDAHPDWFTTAGIVYDAEALFSLRDVMQRRLQGESISEIEVETLVKEETSLAHGAAAVLSVSNAERARFVAAGHHHTRVLGHALSACPTPSGFAERRGLLFVGAIHEPSCPNADSIEWFVAQVLPAFHEALHEQASLTVVGANASPRIAELGSTQVRIVGSVSDLTGFYDRARVFVAPTRFGAGLPFKVHHAAAYGVPVVCTPLIADQLGWRDGVELLVADDAPSFALKCAALYRDPSLWKALRDAALDRVREECSFAAFTATLRQTLAEAARAQGAATSA